MEKLVGKRIHVFILLVFVMFATGCSGISEKVSNDNSTSNLRVQNWIEDIDYLYQNLPKAHNNLYHSIKKEDFKKEMLDLKNDVPKLKDYEIKCRLAQVVASIGDAHTSLNLEFNVNSTYPIVLQWFDQELRVVSTDKEHKDILGKELLSINNKPIDDIMKKVDSLISHENDQWLKVIDVQYIMMPDVLKAMGVALEDKVQFLLEDDNNNISKVELYPGNLTLENAIRVMDEMPVKPLRLQYKFNNLTDSLYWYKYLPENKILYFQYN